jgi:hypothetical protein
MLETAPACQSTDAPQPSNTSLCRLGARPQHVLTFELEMSSEAGPNLAELCSSFSYDQHEFYTWWLPIQTDDTGLLAALSIGGGEAMMLLVVYLFFCMQNVLQTLSLVLEEDLLWHCFSFELLGALVDTQWQLQNLFHFNFED